MARAGDDGSIGMTKPDGGKVAFNLTSADMVRTNIFFCLVYVPWIFSRYYLVFK